MDGVGGLAGDGDRLDRVDRHPVDGGIEVGDTEPDGAADPDERDESGHAPVEELAGTDAEVFAGFRFGEQATGGVVDFTLHDANRAVSTKRRVCCDTRHYAPTWVRELWFRNHIWQGSTPTEIVMSA